MTLVIAGYEHSKSMDYSDLAEDHSITYTPKMEPDGLFVVADSAITSHAGGRTLLNGFRKIHRLEAKLWKPYFQPNGSFSGYREVYETRPLFVAFAGSTLTAQHILNSITTHLSELRISCEKEYVNDAIQYNVIRSCQKNPLSPEGTPVEWDNNTFLNRDFERLLTGEVIAKTIEYSINDALQSASRYKLSMDEFNAMHTELVSGVWCPVSKRHELYVYRMASKPGDDEALVAYTQKELVPETEVAVLGMRKMFESLAQHEFSKAMLSFTSPAYAMFDFLNNAIDQVKNSGSKEIDKPMTLWCLKEQSLTRKKYLK